MKRITSLPLDDDTLRTRADRSAHDVFGGKPAAAEVEEEAQPAAPVPPFGAEQPTQSVRSYVSAMMEHNRERAAAMAVLRGARLVILRSYVEPDGEDRER
jgi:hypothetical protein